MKSLAAFTATHRFGLAPRPGEADDAAADPRGWLEAQTRRAPAGPAARPAAEILAAIAAARIEGREARMATLRQLNREALRGGILRRATHMTRSAAPFAERMVLFWSNHFTVSSKRGTIAAAIPSYEAEAIRPHVFGRFADMLKAAAQHPCMLAYLDNIASVGPDSPAGRRLTKRRETETTLNENLAREILELHTLGVNGGYAQKDVEELAHALTGWSYGRTRRRGDPPTGAFAFYPARHQPGPRRVLGRTYPEGGAEQGLAILDDLARHPSTARHVATKLARHFVADDPPEDAVETLAATFLETDGDLGAVSRALIGLDAAWEMPPTKIKTPYELVIAAHRCAGIDTPRQGDIFQPLRELGHVPFRAPSPQGWGDRASDWLTPESLMRRVEWLRRFAGSLPADLHPPAFLDATIGPVAAPATRTWVDRAPSTDAGLALILASPEFQRR